MNGPGRRALSDAQVAEIRAVMRSHAPRGTQRRLAREYGVSEPTIARVVAGRGYREPANRPDTVVKRLRACAVGALREARLRARDCAWLLERIDAMQSSGKD